MKRITVLLLYLVIVLFSFPISSLAESGGGVIKDYSKYDWGGCEYNDEQMGLLIALKDTYPDLNKFYIEANTTSGWKKLCVQSVHNMWGSNKVVYGHPQDVPNNDRDSQTGEYRYSGFTVGATHFSNANFPPDMAATSNAVTREFFITPWDKNHIIKNRFRADLPDWQWNMMTDKSGHGRDELAAMLHRVVDHHYIRDGKCPTGDCRGYFDQPNQHLGYPLTGDKLVDYAVIHLRPSPWHDGFFSMWHKGPTNNWYETYRIRPDPIDVTNNLSILEYSFQMTPTTPKANDQVEIQITVVNTPHAETVHLTHLNYHWEVDGVKVGDEGTIPLESLEPGAIEYVKIPTVMPARSAAFVAEVNPTRLLPNNEVNWEDNKRVWWITAEMPNISVVEEGFHIELREPWKSWYERNKNALREDGFTSTEYYGDYDYRQSRRYWTDPFGNKQYNPFSLANKPAVISFYIENHEEDEDSIFDPKLEWKYGRQSGYASMVVNDFEPGRKQIVLDNVNYPSSTDRFMVRINEDRKSPEYESDWADNLADWLVVIDKFNPIKTPPIHHRNVHYHDAELYWDAVPEADRYLVVCNGKTVYNDSKFNVITATGLDMNTDYRCTLEAFKGSVSGGVTSTTFKTKNLLASPAGEMWKDYGLVREYQKQEQPISTVRNLKGFDYKTKLSSSNHPNLYSPYFGEKLGVYAVPNTREALHTWEFSYQVPYTCCSGSGEDRTCDTCYRTVWATDSCSVEIPNVAPSGWTNITNDPKGRILQFQSQWNSKIFNIPVVSTKTKSCVGSHPKNDSKHQFDYFVPTKYKVDPIALIDVGFEPRTQTIAKKHQTLHILFKGKRVRGLQDNGRTLNIGTDLDVQISFPHLWSRVGNLGTGN